MEDRDRDLLREAADWVQARAPCAGAEDLRRLAAERGIDFATAALYQALRRSPRHGPFIARVEGLGPEPLRTAAEIAVVPGAFYREAPHTGADGHLLRQTAARFGFATTLVPLQSFGRVAVNAGLLAGWPRWATSTPRPARPGRTHWPRRRTCASSTWWAFPCANTCPRP